MSTIKQLNQLIEESSSLKYIAQAYTEISAVKLKKIRHGIEKNRLFSRELAQVMQVIQEVAAKKGVRLKDKNKNTLSILITSNYHFCGNLESRLVSFFMVNTAKVSTDRLVIGKSGQEMLSGLGYFHPFKQITLQKDLPGIFELKNLATGIVNYQQVIVYHTRMRSVLIQEATVTDITQKHDRLKSFDIKPDLIGADYIFEPEIDRMIYFFTTQIAALLLEQAFFEAELARTAARLISMDQAQLNADKVIRQQKTALSQAKRSQINMQLLETAASLIKWRKENNVFG